MGLRGLSAILFATGAVTVLRNTDVDSSNFNTYETMEHQVYEI